MANGRIIESISNFPVLHDTYTQEELNEASGIAFQALINHLAVGPYSYALKKQAETFIKDIQGDKILCINSEKKELQELHVIDMRKVSGEYDENDDYQFDKEVAVMLPYEYLLHVYNNDVKSLSEIVQMLTIIDYIRTHSTEELYADSEDLDELISAAKNNLQTDLYDYDFEDFNNINEAQVVILVPDISEEDDLLYLQHSVNLLTTEPSNSDTNSSDIQGPTLFPIPKHLSNPKSRGLN